MPKPLQARRTYRYTDEFKAYAVLMSLRDDVLVQDVAARLDIHPFMLSRWRKAHRDGILIVKKTKGKEAPTPPMTELQTLKQENARLKKENDLLKKWQRYLADLRQSGSGS